MALSVYSFQYLGIAFYTTNIVVFGDLSSPVAYLSLSILLLLLPLLLSLLLLVLLLVLILFSKVGKNPSVLRTRVGHMSQVPESLPQGFKSDFKGFSKSFISFS